MPRMNVNEGSSRSDLIKTKNPDSSHCFGRQRGIRDGLEPNEWTIPSPASSGKLLPFAETERSIFVTPPAHFSDARAEAAMGEPALAIPGLGVAAIRLVASSDEGSRPLNDATMRRALEKIPDLSLLEEQLLFRVCCLSLQRGYAWISQAELAKLLRCKERALRDATARVCELGLLNTVRSWEGLSYLPQWEALGISRPVRKSDRLVKSAGGDRQNSPMHCRSTSSGSDKKESSRERVPRPEAAASFSKSLEAEPQEQRVVDEPPELAAVVGQFGAEAARDIREVLRTAPVRRDPSVGRVALERLLRLSPSEIRTNPGACFRGFVRLASEGRLAAPPALAFRGAQTPARVVGPAPIDPLEAKMHGVRDRLSYLPVTHPHRAKFAAELAELERVLGERQSSLEPRRDCA